MHQVQHIPIYYDNYVWALHHPDKPHCIIVDPGEAEPILAYLDQHQQSLQAILVTHHHDDHIAGITDITAQHPVPVYGNRTDTISPITHPIDAGTSISIPGLEISAEVLDFTGHTLTHLGYFFAESGHNPPRLFCGDTVFMGGCGRLFEGTGAQMYQTFQRIMALPDHTLLYCAHEYTIHNLAFASTVEPDNHKILERISQTQSLQAQGKPSVPATLATEKATNPFMRVHLPNIQSAVSKQSGNPIHSPEQTFTELRAWKDIF